MSIFMTAQFTVKPESVDVCRQAIAEFVDYVTRNEPETHMYISVQDSADETHFLNFFEFESEAAQEHHANSEAVKKFTAILYPECIHPVEFTTYQLVASTEE